MAEANVNDRDSVERLYPREDFERDAGANSDAKATVHRGLRVLSAVDLEGRFRAERGSRHVGECDPESDTLFLAPFLKQAYAALQQTDVYGGAAENSDALAKTAHERDEYRAFIDRIIDAAKSADFKAPIGRGEKRLQGFHGG